MAHYPPPDNPQVCKVALIFQRDTREAVNTFHVSKSTGWTISTMTDLANAVLTWWNTVYKLAIPPGVALAQIQVRLLDPTNPLAVDMPISPPSPGTRVVTVLEAANVTAAMSERTGKAGRAHRGRIYAPGIGEGDCSTTDTLSSVLVGLLGAAIGNLVFGALPAGEFLSIFHRPGLIPKPLDNTFDVVNTYVMENIIDSQRRRLPGRGR